MEIASACVLRFDFVLADRVSETHEKLDELYASCEENVDPTFFGFAPGSQLETRGTGTIGRYTGLRLEEADTDTDMSRTEIDAFESVQTFVLHQEDRRFHDLISVAMFSEEQLRIINQGSSSDVAEQVNAWQGSVSWLGKELESLVFDRQLFSHPSPLTGHAEILYFQTCDDHLVRDDGELQPSDCEDYLEDDLCRKCLLNQEGCISMLESGELIGTQTVGDVWGPLTAINIHDSSSEYTLEPTETWDLPRFGILVNQILPFFRAYDWAHYTLADTEVVSDEIVDTGSNILEIDADGGEYLQQLTYHEEELGQTQKYMYYTKREQELEDVRNLAGRHNYQNSDDDRFTDYEVPVSHPTDTSLRSTIYFEDSLFKTYRADIDHLLTKLETNIQGVDEKQTRISGIITDKVVMKGTQSSVELNSQVQWLTRVLVGLTVVLVLLAIPWGSLFDPILTYLQYVIEFYLSQIIILIR